jgi:hypothetical protein
VTDDIYIIFNNIYIDENFQRYCQPPIPASFAPRRSYQKSGQAFEDTTIYKLSYKTTSGINLRRKPILQRTNLILSSKKMAVDTVHKVSFYFLILMQLFYLNYDTRHVFTYMYCFSYHIYRIL